MSLRAACMMQLVRLWPAFVQCSVKRELKGASCALGIGPQGQEDFSPKDEIIQYFNLRIRSEMGISVVYRSLCFSWRIIA